MSIRAGKIGRPIIFGEVLFDCFDDGSITLGGAPFNVAWHLHAFRLEPLFVSRVGDDALGHRILETMGEHGLDTAGIQLDTTHPTGRVTIRLQQGQPSFDIVDDQAYDHIDPTAAVELIRRTRPALLYHGTLAVRHGVSRHALNALMQEVSAPRFVDVNLRDPWWQREEVLQLLEQASWVKLNDAELAALTSLSAADVPEAAETLRREVAAEGIIVTLGARGAALIHRGIPLVREPPVLTELADTVGAGDAFSAVVILGLLSGWESVQTLERALEFASAVCRVRGALLHDAQIYRSYLEKWSE